MKLYSINFKLINHQEDDYDILKNIFDNTIYSGVTSKYFIKSKLNLDEVKNKIELSDITKDAKFIITDYLNRKIAYSKDLPIESTDFINLINELYTRD